MSDSRTWVNQGNRTVEMVDGRETGRFTYGGSPNGPGPNDPIFDRRGNVITRGWKEQQTSSGQERWPDGY